MPEKNAEIDQFPDPDIFAELIAAQMRAGELEKMCDAYRDSYDDILGANYPEKFLCLKDQSRYKIFYGGRGGAKSYSFAKALIARTHTQKTRVLCTREFQSSIADSVYRLISDQISEANLDRFFTITKNSITHINGSEFIFKGLQRSIQEIKSTEGIDICWVEEAQVISETSWEVLIPTIRKNNSEIWISFNPDDEKDPTYQRFVINTPPDSILQKVGWEDNPHFPATLDAERRYMLEIDPEAYEHVWDGECRKISDAIIFRSRFEISSFPEPPEDIRKYYGLDYGFSVSPTAFVRCWIMDNILYIDREAWGVGVELDDTPAFLDTILEHKEYPVSADSARPETTSQLCRKGYKVTSAQKWPGSVEDGITVMKGFKKIVIHERCQRTAEDFRLYSYKVDKQTNEILPIIVKKHDDCIDAIRYSLVNVIAQPNFFDDCDYRDFPS
jgi:phage terminase large subunit